jgi:hypothetical protein
MSFHHYPPFGFDRSNAAQSSPRIPGIKTFDELGFEDGPVLPDFNLLVTLLDCLAKTVDHVLEAVLASVREKSVHATLQSASIALRCQNGAHRC